MDDALFDLSWSCHHTSIASDAYTRLFTSASQTTPDRLASCSTRLTTFLQTVASHSLKDDFDFSADRLGAFKECKWIKVPQHNVTDVYSSTVSGGRRRNVLSVSIIYASQTQRFILCSPNLILSKASARLSRHVFDFLAQEFDGVSFDVLKLPSRVLIDGLAGYVSYINRSCQRLQDSDEEGEEGPDDNGEDLHRLSLLKTAMGTLKLTISFGAPVAPDLKTLDLDIPHDTVNTLTRSRPTTLTDTTHAPQPSHSSDAGSRFLQTLTHHISEQTGLKLPLLPSPQHDSAAAPGSSTHEGDAPGDIARVSKITTAAFAISTEGKLKFARRPVEAAGRFEPTLREAASLLLDRCDAEAAKREAVS